MSNQIKLSANTMAIKVIIILGQKKFIHDEANLFLKLEKGNISVVDYFTAAEEIAKYTPSSKIPHDWNELKLNDPVDFEHEASHKNVFDKYGIRSTLHKVDGFGVYVIDEDFKDVAIKNNKTIAEVKQIFLELYLAATQNNQHATQSDLLDIFYAEILKGNIRNLNLKEIKNAFRKYNWS